MTKISVRPVDHSCETQELLGILQANLPNLPHARRFDWLYRGNPDGPAWSWFVWEGTPDHVVGVTSLFPRSMWVGEKLKRCGQVGDFAISPSHRSLGPALLLQRATFCPVDREELEFCYDCPPHEAGMSTFRRLGIRPNCGIDRYALPLRVDLLMRKRLGAASAIPAAAANLLLRLHRRSVLRTRMSGLEVSEHAGAFGEEFSQLDASVKKTNAIRGRRTAALLNWRYREDPLHQYRVWTARRQGELIAFVIVFATNEVVTIVDLFGTELQGAAIILLAAIVECFEGAQQSVEAYLAPGSELIGNLLKTGFRLRSQSAQVVAYAKPQSEMAGFLQGSPIWAFSQAELLA
jgi:hypothetical protein